MRVIDEFITWVEKIIVMVLMAAMAIVITTAVVYRYFLNDPITWASEASIFMMAWLTFLGASLGLKYKAQASITIITDKLSDKNRRRLDIFTHVIILICLAYLVYVSYDWFYPLTNKASSAMRLPMWVPYASVPVGLTFALIHLLTYTLKTIMRTKP